MPLGSFASVGSDSKRQRALPIPRASANMKTFTPDSSIASDVIPSANFGERNKGRLPDMIVLHYTGMPGKRPLLRSPKLDRKSTRLNSSHRCRSYAVFCLKKKNRKQARTV